MGHLAAAGAFAGLSGCVVTCPVFAASPLVLLIVVFAIVHKPSGYMSPRLDDLEAWVLESPYSLP